MNEIIDRNEWSAFLKNYASRNAGRPTRLGVFRSDEGFGNDLWIEDDLPLVALDVYPNNGKTRIDILFDNFTHTIDDAAKLVDIEGEDSDGGLDISDAMGNTTIMRFEDWPLEKEE